MIRYLTKFYVKSKILMSLETKQMCRFET